MNKELKNKVIIKLNSLKEHYLSEEIIFSSRIVYYTEHKNDFAYIIAKDIDDILGDSMKVLTNIKQELKEINEILKQLEVD
jgi:hypothetical protein